MHVRTAVTVLGEESHQHHIRKKRVIKEAATVQCQTQHKNLTKRRTGRRQKQNGDELISFQEGSAAPLFNKASSSTGLNTMARTGINRKPLPTVAD